MRTTLDLPEYLLLEAMKITHIKTKTIDMNKGKVEKSDYYY